MKTTTDINTIKIFSTDSIVSELQRLDFLNIIHILNVNFAHSVEHNDS